MLQYSFQQVWVEVTAIVPALVAALALLVVGVIVGNVLKRITITIFKNLKIDTALDAAGVDALTEKTGYKLQSGLFVGSLVKWFILIVFIVAALDVLNLDQATAFLSSVVLNYLPQVIVAVVILLGGIIVANFVEKVVAAGVTATKIATAGLLSKFAKFAILAFTALAVLNQLSIAPELVQMLFAGLVFGLSLAFGLAFGLGGKEVAADTLKKLHGKQSHNSHHSN